MPNMIMPRRNKTVATLTGHTIRFDADKPTHVPPVAVKECADAGAIPADDDAARDLQERTDGTPPPSTPVSTERDDVILAAVRQVIEANRPTDFTASGAPKAPVISSMVRFQVMATEVAAAVEKIRAETNPEGGA